MNTTNHNTVSQTVSPEKLSDKELFALCKKFGSLSLEARRKFAGLLPEVNRRNLHRRKGFASIHEFAAKLAGMNRTLVDKVLRLSENLTDKPSLKRQLETGAQGWSKIERVAFIATPETEKMWAAKVQDLSSQALRAFVHEVKIKNEQIDRLKVTAGGELENKQEMKQGGEDSLGSEGHADRDNHSDRDTGGDALTKWNKLTFSVAPEVEQEFRIFKQENNCLTFNETLQALLKEVKKKRAKVSINICPECTLKKAEKMTNNRHIPAAVRHMIKSEHKGLCAFPNCSAPASSLHHTRRFALQPNHKHIVPLCDAHEQLVHAGLITNEEAPPQKWRLSEQPDIHHPKFQVDQAVQRHRFG